jgi:hypothetical protein
MLAAEYAISRCRRDLTLSAMLRFILAMTALACLLVGPFSSLGTISGMVLTAVGVIWITLSFRSAKTSQLAQASSSLIATGQWERAEQQIEQALRAFSLFRNNKLLSLHNLAVLRHAQNRYPETAVLCRALLGQRLGSLKNLSKSSRLILADALLEMGDLRGAYGAFFPLHEERLTLGEAVQLLVTEMDYSSRVAAWPQMLEAVMTKVQLAELMPTHSAAIVQAMLALAAMKVGRADLSDWLRRRAELLVDREELVRQKPALKELWDVNT